jgi:hypothetical protein
VTGQGVGGFDDLQSGDIAFPGTFTRDFIVLKLNFRGPR